MKTPVRIVFITLLLGTAGITGWYMVHAKGSKPPLNGAPISGAMPPSPVVVARLIPKTLSINISAVGTLQAAESAELRTEVAGLVKAIPLQEGQHVTKDQVLIELDDSIIKTDLAQAEAVLINARATYKRSQELQKNNYISTQELDQSKSLFQAAQAAADSARIKLAKTKIKAPFDGIAGLRNFSVGDYIKIGDLLTTVDKIDTIKVDFNIPEKSFSQIKTGQHIQVETDAFPGRSFDGKIYAIDSRINTDTRNFLAKAIIDNADGALRSGMFARLRVDAGVREHTMMLPEEALSPKGSEQYVFVAKNGKAVMTHVVTGTRDSGLIEIIEGLSPDDDIITEGVVRIRDGSPIMIQSQKHAEGEDKP